MRPVYVTAVPRADGRVQLLGNEDGRPFLAESIAKICADAHSDAYVLTIEPYSWPGMAPDGRRTRLAGKPCKHATADAPICAFCVRKRKQVADRYKRITFGAGDGAKPAKTEPPSEVALRRGNRVGDGSRAGSALRGWGAR